MLESLFNKVAEDLKARRPATLLKRDSNGGVFPVKFEKFLITPFSTITPLMTAPVIFKYMTLYSVFRHLI